MEEVLHEGSETQTSAPNGTRDKLMGLAIVAHGLANTGSGLPPKLKMKRWIQLCENKEVEIGEKDDKGIKEESSKKKTTVEQTSSSAARRSLLDEAAISRNMRIALKVLVFIGKQTWKERVIRLSLGNTPDISKGLRTLLCKNLVMRSGKGKRGSPYYYQASKHGIDALEAMSLSSQQALGSQFEIPEE